MTKVPGSRFLTAAEDGSQWRRMASCGRLVVHPPTFPPWQPQPAPVAHHADASQMQGRACSPGLDARPTNVMAFMSLADSEKCFRLQSQHRSLI